MFSSLLKPAKVMLFRTTREYLNFERITLSKEEKLYMMKWISPNSFSAWNQHDDKYVVFLNITQIPFEFVLNMLIFI
jgi:hypothetical protein